MIRHFLQKLVPYKVRTWSPSSDDPQAPPDRVASSLVEGDVISSILKDQPDHVSKLPLPLGYPVDHETRHIVVLDIDYPAALIPSETANHFHLFLDVPGGIPQNEYMGLLKKLSELGVIEKGYYAASWQRGHSDVRLPWVSKAESAPTTVLTTAADGFPNTPEGSDDAAQAVEGRGLAAQVAHEPWDTF